jgi:hypothetical protein
MMGEPLCFWVITKHPSDFPRHYAMRRQYVDRGRIINHPFAGLYGTLEEARFDVPEGLYRLPRYPNDDPVIVECWL